MQSFIVLGIVPGTNFQLNFDFWLIIAISLATIPFFRSLWRRRSVVSVYIVAFQLERFIAQYQLPA
jgi:hypothetical protein